MSIECYLLPIFFKKFERVHFDADMTSESELFSGCHVFIHPAGLGKKRLSLFETQIVKHGGNLVKTLTGNSLVTHVILDDSVLTDLGNLKQALSKTKFNSNERPKVIRTQWLSHCLKVKKRVETSQYEVAVDTDHSIMQYVNSKNLARLDSQVEDVSWSNNSNSPPKKLKIDATENYECSQAASNSSKEHNLLIISELQKLANAFRSSGDQWRSHGYDKGISAIKAYGKEITCVEEVTSLPGIGQKMAAKIQEILEFGKLRKVDEICNSEKVKAVELFTKVWGAGPSTAESWYLQGYRTLEDLCTKANLTKQQKIGLQYFDDIQDQMPREEVEQIFAVVSEAALAIEPSLTVMLCGSYRRGKAMCGDVDVLISKKGHVTGDILTRVLPKLRESGFITDDLVSMETNGNQKKYLGLCRLPGDGRKHRRLDIFLIPDSEFAPALMHYTGSALFNRSIRILAAKKNMSLSEHSLLAGVIKDGKDKIIDGYTLPTPTEESIFEHLGLQYLPPEERNHTI